MKAVSNLIVSCYCVYEKIKKIKQVMHGISPNMFHYCFLLRSSYSSTSTKELYGSMDMDMANEVTFLLQLKCSTIWLEQKLRAKSKFYSVVIPRSVLLKSKGVLLSLTPSSSSWFMICMWREHLKGWLTCLLQVSVTRWWNKKQPIFPKN